MNYTCQLLFIFTFQSSTIFQVIIWNIIKFKLKIKLVILQGKNPLNFSTLKIKIQLDSKGSKTKIPINTIERKGEKKKKGEAFAYVEVGDFITIIISTNKAENNDFIVKEKVINHAFFFSTSI